MKTSFLERIKKVFFLDENVYVEVSDDKGAILQGIIILLTVGFLMAVGLIITSYIPIDFVKENIGPVFGVFDFIILPLYMLISWPILAFIMHIFAKLLGGKATYIGFLRAIAFTNIPAALMIVPLIGGAIGGLWVFICGVTAVKAVHKVSWIRAIVIIFISLIVSTTLFWLLFFMLIIVLIFTGSI